MSAITIENFLQGCWSSDYWVALSFSRSALYSHNSRISRLRPVLYTCQTTPKWVPVRGCPKIYPRTFKPFSFPYIPRTIGLSRPSSKPVRL